MRINIATGGGRFHLLDLARELEKLGHEVHFYSFTPTRRCMQFGLKRQNCNSYFIVAIPFLALYKLTHFGGWAEDIYNWFFDHFMALFMKPCDVFIGHSPIHNYALRAAKRRFGATVILERGISHVLTQLNALRSNPANDGKKILSDWHIHRDLRGYEWADYISVASQHVVDSFTSHGIPAEKLFKNPYGARLEHFQPTTLSTDQPVYDVLMTGQWCHRKGCDLLYQACDEMGLRLLHVGPLRDLPFPQTERMHHVDAVDEQQLRNYYSQARTFVLPSRDEGLALVQAQAMLCGLPLVCSHYTGGEELRNMLPDKRWVVVMQEYTLSELKRCIQQALALAATQTGPRNYAGNALQDLTWEGYAKRYDQFLRSLDIANNEDK